MEEELLGYATERLTACVRPSLAFYNTRAEVDALVAAVQSARTRFAK